MQVKKFEAPTIQEALKVIKQEMGPDAIILSTKENRGGFGLMKKGSVEVTAAISKKDLQKKLMAEKMLPQDVKQKIWDSSATKQKNIYDDYFERQLEKSNNDKIEISSNAPRKPAKNDGREELREKRYVEIMEEDVPEKTVRANSRSEKISMEILRPNPSAVPKAPASARTEEAPSQVKALEAEIDDLKMMVKHLANSRVQPQPEAEEGGGQTDEMLDAYRHLIQAGVDKRYARELVKSAEFELNPMERRNSAAIQEKMAMAFMERIQIADVLKNVGAASGVSTTKFIAIVGPTGVGKTTTAAKIASQAFIEKRMRVGLINLDSYKVAAADQLATYAKLMNCPFRSVNNKAELQQAVHDFSSLDLVIIDTTGRSQKDQSSLNEMKNLLSVIKDLSVLLTVSATTRESDVSDIVGRFKIFGPEGLIFSKLDETSVFGPIFNAQIKTGIPLTFFTVGQRVPEDIERASAERLVALLLEL